MQPRHHQALELSEISKAFDGRSALTGASFEVQWHEVHALLGENGAGKSTLMNVACGLYTPDSGSLSVGGVHVEISKPADAIRHGIGMVHQHFKLVERFTVAENVFLYCGHVLGVSSAREAGHAVREKSEELDLRVDPDALVGEISIAEQQRVEILKMLLAGARVLILDEPTAVLTDKESENVLALLRGMAEDGCAVVLITHKLREVLGYSDRVTVMRGGKVVIAGVDTSDLNRESLARAMVGDAAAGVTREEVALGKDRYVVKDLVAENPAGGVGANGVSFRVRHGEIYGVAGVGGNGQSQLADALMGLAEPESGQVTIGGVDITHESVSDRRRRGIRFIPADRFHSGLIAEFQAYENFGLTNISNYGSWTRVGRGQMRRETTDAIDTHQILGCSATTRSSLLSGGNAQKLLLARELDSELSTIIAHSPTRGLDVQACNAVHSLILDATHNGAACVLISEDLEEILAISTTIAVMSRGKIVGEFQASDATREKIGELMLGHA